MTDPVRLEPCPFCGGRAEHSGDGPKDAPYLGHWVICTECGSGNGDGGSYYTLEAAAAAWNRRASPPAARDVQPDEARDGEANVKEIIPGDTRRLDWLFFQPAVEIIKTRDHVKSQSYWRQAIDAAMRAQGHEC